MTCRLGESLEHFNASSLGRLRFTTLDCDETENCNDINQKTRQSYSYLPPGMSHAPLSPGDSGLTWGRFRRMLGRATLSKSIDSSF